MPFRAELLEHAKLNGDLDGGKFEEKITFFTHEPEMASAYAENLAYYEDECPLSLNIVIFPCLLSIKNLAVVNRAVLFEIGRRNKHDNLAKFSDNFEDSIHEEMETVFNELKYRGYDGALITRDLMPKYNVGDFGYKKCPIIRGICFD